MAKKDAAEQMMSPKKQIANILFLVVILAATIIILFQTIYNPQDPVTEQEWDRVNYLWLVPAVICFLVSVSCEALNLKMLSGTIGYPRTFRQGFIYASSDLYFSSITPSATGGQPAAAYYMTKDGVPLSLSTAVLVLNVTMYTTSLFAAALIAFLLRPRFFLDFSGFEKVCVILGIAFHLLLVLFCLTSMASRRWMKFVGRVLFGFLAKLRIIRNREEQVARFEAAIASYQDALRIVRRHRYLLPAAFSLAILQRLFSAVITNFVFLALGLNLNVFDIVAMQLYCMVGSNAMPLPGAVGISEALYISMTVGIVGDRNLCMVSMFFSRGLSTYLPILVCGAVTITHHIRIKRAEFRRAKAALGAAQSAAADTCPGGGGDPAAPDPTNEKEP